MVPELSRSQVARLAGEGLVRIGDAAVKPSRRLKRGETVEVELSDASGAAPEPEPIALQLVHRDDAILVVDKPAGLVVHPAPGHPSGTLVNALLALDPGLRVGQAHRPGLVHRLDRDTSGLMVVARTDAALRDLQAQWASRGVLKSYVALVVGQPRLDQARIEAPIGRNPRDRKRMAVTDSGREATTDVRVVERLGGFALVEARIRTGRTHQIRVHLASIGHPVAGDPVYGARVAGLDRQFLHAARLGFRHPTTGAWVEFESALPGDLADFLERVRRSARIG
jgi:23S rRNA pseudouridine1911/1915/1917 synthase